MVHEQLREIARDLRTVLLKGGDMLAIENAAWRLEQIASALDYTGHRKALPTTKLKKQTTETRKVRQTFSRAS